MPATLSSSPSTLLSSHLVPSPVLHPSSPPRYFYYQLVNIYVNVGLGGLGISDQLFLIIKDPQVHTTTHHNTTAFTQTVNVIVAVETVYPFLPLPFIDQPRHMHRPLCRVAPCRLDHSISHSVPAPVPLCTLFVLTTLSLEHSYTALLFTSQLSPPIHSPALHPLSPSHLSSSPHPFLTSSTHSPSWRAEHRGSAGRHSTCGVPLFPQSNHCEGNTHTIPTSHIPHTPKAQAEAEAEA
jgi:hypothetical protein